MKVMPKSATRQLTWELLHVAQEWQPLAGKRLMILIG